MYADRLLQLFRIVCTDDVSVGLWILLSGRVSSGLEISLGTAYYDFFDDYGCTETFSSLSLGV